MVKKKNISQKPKTGEPELIWKQVKKVFDKLIGRLYGHGYETVIVSVRGDDDVSHCLCSQGGETYLTCRDIPTEFLAFCKGASREKTTDVLTSSVEKRHDPLPVIKEGTTGCDISTSGAPFKCDTESESEEHDGTISDNDISGVQPSLHETCVEKENEMNESLRSVVTNSLCDTVAAPSSPTQESDIADSSESVALVDDDNTELACGICSKTFSRRASKYRHMRTCHVYKFHCTVDGCEAQFQSEYKLKKHTQKEHTVNKPVQFNCSMCPRSFNHRSGLDRHVEYRHCTDRPWQCDQCPATFQGKLGLKEHMNTHNRTKDYICEICGKVFKTRLCIYKHMRWHKLGKRYKCDVCGQAYLAKGNLSAHIMKKKHFSDTQLESELSFQQCDTCGLKLADTYRLKRHMNTHIQTAFVCTFCTKSFNNKYNLGIHERLHTGIRPSCDTCNIIFRSTRKLHEHIKDTHALDIETNS